VFIVVTQGFLPDIGGIANHLAGVAERLAAEAPVEVFAHRIREGGAEWQPHPFAALHRFGAPTPLRGWLKRRALREPLARPGLRGVICDSWKSAEILPPTEAPVLVLALGMEFPPNPSARRIRRIRAALAKASVVLPISRHTAAQVAPYLTPGTKVEIVPPGISPQPVPTAAARAALRERVGPGPLVATLCRLEPRKGVDRVIGALPDLLPRHPGLRHVIAGGGEDRARLEALATRLGVAPHVNFLGRVDEAQKAALLAEADIFAMPVRREGASVEGFGIVYLEAGWHGCPSIAGSEGGAEDAVAHGETGLVCEGADQASVTAALAALLDDAPRRHALGQTAAARVRAGFLWEQIVPRLLVHMPARDVQA
jgi:phosphatidyl-myo-inositol dimannoside synthase